MVLIIIIQINGHLIILFNNGTGWTLYPPLSTSLISLSPIGIDILL